MVNQLEFFDDIASSVPMGIDFESSAMSITKPLHLSVIGAGPVGLALALLAAQRLPQARVTLWDARQFDTDIASDPRTLALSLGSVQLLERLQAWPAQHSQAINAVHVSQHSPAWGLSSEATVQITAQDEGVPMLGAVMHYGHLCHALQQQWHKLSTQSSQRLQSRFGTPVASINNQPHSVEVDAGIVEESDLAVIAEGGVFAKPGNLLLDRERARSPLTLDYHQTAWVGQVNLTQPHGGMAYERFTADGPVALLPLPASAGVHAGALVWCVPTARDPVAGLNSLQRQHLLNTLLHPQVGRVCDISALKSFSLGLRVHHSLTQGRTVRIGNAAQTLHPVAGQGLNLGLRDAYALVQALRQGDVSQALRQLEWQRGPDRWALLATTDFLARSFAWQLPVANTLRGLGLAALEALGPLKSRLAHQMMFGFR